MRSGEKNVRSLKGVVGQEGSFFFLLKKTSAGLFIIKLYNVMFICVHMYMYIYKFILVYTLVTHCSIYFGLKLRCPCNVSILKCDWGPCSEGLLLVIEENGEEGSGQEIHSLAVADRWVEAAEGTAFTHIFTFIYIYIFIYMYMYMYKYVYIYVHVPNCFIYEPPPSPLTSKKSLPTRGVDGGPLNFWASNFLYFS